MEKSKWRPMALQAAGWGLLHGDFFDLCDVAEQFRIPVEIASELVLYLRKVSYVETISETRSCKREAGKRSPQRVFIKVLAIHPEPLPDLQSFRLNVLRSKLARLSKAMPSPRGSR
ncbi:hypothetical protein [Aeromonas hydrophila]|uniref:hypothetical protein n=1 Tax=Aeromonas hydrophila TaxID=644 RepID=UPI001627C067|nr:hypothetical protein [Aeromonas hydrophila]